MLFYCKLSVFFDCFSLQDFFFSTVKDFFTVSYDSVYNVIQCLPMLEQELEKHYTTMLLNAMGIVFFLYTVIYRSLLCITLLEQIAGIKNN